MPPSNSNSVPDNRLLASLPDEEYQRLVPYLEYVTLPPGQILYQSGAVIQYVYFPTRSMVSLVSRLQDNSSAEFALVGNEGMVGFPVFLGGNLTSSYAIVQIPDGAMRMNADVLKMEFERGGVLQRLLLLYAQALFTQVAQNAVCKSHHTMKNRLARWLLSVQDCIQKDELPLTQQYISTLLGTRRATITAVAGTLQQEGSIRYSRGRITILNRKALEATACECYEVVKSECQRLLERRSNS
ncbi:MAG TPA: Crp/Fnr family transcriptional regulator [Cyanobacteria bacterium UBA8803]|nr:Crp/Fnr family transcriptional regulator [Cyanobacteria bacterium UBA9273]HBL61008.1 Crp/Fnr family transcriptional regulator [Cyanobacteria bacterium UBA8803]